jgi:transposase-like protein
MPLTDQRLGFVAWLRGQAERQDPVGAVARGDRRGTAARRAAPPALAGAARHRNLLAHAPEKLHDEITADDTDMIYADDAKDVEKRRHAFLRKCRLKCRAVADSLAGSGDRLFTFTRLPSSQGNLARTTNAIERLHEEFKRRIKTQTVLPSAETAAMLFLALLASGQITMRKVEGWQRLAQNPKEETTIDLAA